MVRSKRSKSFYLSIIDSIKKDGKLPNLPISKQRRNYYLRRLKEQGIIKRIGYGTWEQVKEVKLNALKATSNAFRGEDNNALKDKRGHGFIITFQIPTIKNWNKRERFLTSKNIAFKLVGTNNKTHSIIIQGFKVWLSSKSIVIYTPKNKSYTERTAEEAYRKGLYDLIRILRALETLLDVSFKIQDKYLFNVSRQHYGKIKDSFAEYCNNLNEKIKIVKNGKCWALVDKSIKPGEFETIDKDTGIEDMDKVANPFFNDIRDKKPPLPSEAWEIVFELLKNQKELSAATNIITTYIVSQLPKKEKRIKEDESLKNYFG